MEQLVSHTPTLDFPHWTRLGSAHWVYPAILTAEAAQAFGQLVAREAEHVGELDGQEDEQLELEGQVVRQEDD